MKKSHSKIFFIISIILLVVSFIDMYLNGFTNITIAGGILVIFSLVINLLITE